MALTEELRSLEEMRDKGTLTSEEFTAAKAAAISNGAQAVRTEVPQKKTGASTASKVAVLLFLLGVIWFIGTSVGRPAELLKSAAHMPMDLTNEVENVHAHSWRGVPLTVPYSGSLTVGAQVQRGNPIQMFLTDSAGLEKLKANDGATYVGGFYAPQARAFLHTERINQGTYYLVLRDNSLGILSSTASDVALKVQLAP